MSVMSDGLMHKRLRPRRNHRPPPDAQARRLLRQAAAVPARRLRHHRPGHRPRPHGARPWRGRFRAVQGERHRPGVRGRRGRLLPARTGCGSAGRAASSTTSSTRPTGRSAPTCAKPALCSPRARTSSTAIRIAGGRRPRSSTAARRNGSSRWTGRCRIYSRRESRAEQRWDDEGGVPTPPWTSSRRRSASWRCTPSPTLASFPKRAATASARWSRGVPTGCSAASAPGACRSLCSSSARRGELLVDREVNQRIVAAIREQGVDAWDADNAAAFLGDRNPDDYEMVTDILDVWFDSG